MTQLAEKDPANFRWHREVAVSHGWGCAARGRAPSAPPQARTPSRDRSSIADEDIGHRGMIAAGKSEFKPGGNRGRLSSRGLGAHLPRRLRTKIEAYHAL